MSCLSLSPACLFLWCRTGSRVALAPRPSLPSASAGDAGWVVGTRITDEEPNPCHSSKGQRGTSAWLGLLALSIVLCRDLEFVGS